MEPLLRIDNLHVQFDNKDRQIKAVNGMSFHITKGEILALVGESGSGKSVTALSILRLLPPNGHIVAGHIFYKARDILALSKQELRALRGRCIGLVLQDPLSALNPLFTAGEQIAEVIRWHFKRSKKEARVETLTLMKKIGLSEPDRIYNSYPHELSGGQRQRVLIAAALAAKPDLLLADEPTTALDATVQKNLLQLLKRLESEFDLSILLITHDLGVVAEIADRVCVVDQGTIVETASCKELFKNPQHPITKALINAMPRLHGSSDSTSQPFSGPSLNPNQAS